MKSEIVKIEQGRRLVVDLPLDIVAMDFSYTYYDEELKKERSSHPGHWMVEPNLNRLKGFTFPAKEFRGINTAIDYAKSVYIKYLRVEIKRVKDDY